MRIRIKINEVQDHTLISAINQSVELQKALQIVNTILQATMKTHNDLIAEQVAKRTGKLKNDILDINLDNDELLIELK